MSADVSNGTKHIVDSNHLIREFNAAPPGKLFCLHGATSDVFQLSLHSASHALFRGIPIALVDGFNRFDVHYIAEFARRITARGLANRRVTPEELLHNIHIARAFTCYQMEATITERLPQFLKKKCVPIVMIFGLLDTFYDEQAPLFEVQAGLQRILIALHRLKEQNISVLLASQDVKPASKERNQLFSKLATAMDYVFTDDVQGRVINNRYKQLHRKHT